MIYFYIELKSSNSVLLTVRTCFLF